MRLLHRATRPVVHVLGDVVNGVHVCARCGAEIFIDMPEANRDIAERAIALHPVGIRVLFDGTAVAIGSWIAGGRDCRGRVRILSGAKR